jgi:hypothetical protein
MNRPLFVSSIALAVLAGCATEHRVTPAPAPVVVAPAPAPTVAAPAGTVVVPQGSTASTVVLAPTPAPLRAGMGRIDSIVPVPAAAAGATMPGATKRIGIKMDDGTVQFVDTDAASLAVGDRVEITREGTMRHPVM